MVQGKHVRSKPSVNVHQDNALNDEEHGQDNVHLRRVATDTDIDPLMSEEALPVFTGKLAFFGMHRGPHVNETPLARHNAEVERR